MLPTAPTDPNNQLPVAPIFPPTQQDVLVAQAAQVAPPQDLAPAWFQAGVNQLRADVRADVRAFMTAEILPDLKRLLNETRGQGEAIPYDIVPFPNGDNPTLPPHNLPALRSRNDVYALVPVHLNTYLTRYAVGPVPPGANPQQTNKRKKDALFRKIKA